MKHARACLRVCARSFLARVLIAPAGGQKVRWWRRPRGALTPGPRLPRAALRAASLVASAPAWSRARRARRAAAPRSWESSCCRCAALGGPRCDTDARQLLRGEADTRSHVQSAVRRPYGGAVAQLPAHRSWRRRLHDARVTRQAGPTRAGGRRCQAVHLSPSLASARSARSSTAMPA